MSFKDTLLDLLFPPRCPFCRKLLRYGEKGVCLCCMKTLPFIPESNRERKLKHIDVCVSSLYYEESVRESLLRYKFRGLTAYRWVYGNFVAKCIDESKISCDIITWVPLSRKRLRKRGYDQAQLIAESAAAELGLPCVRLMKKLRDNPPQSTAGGKDKREANARGAYACTDGEQLREKSVLIIDDIVTTGSTLEECAKVLRAAGAERVYAAAVAGSRE